MHRLRNLHAAVDLRLLAGGAAGFLIFFLLLPYVHPDAGVGQLLPKNEIRARADAEVERLGLDVSQFIVRSHLRRDSGLLESIQEEARLPIVVERLRSGRYSPLPAYHHQIRYSRSSGGADEPELVAEVWLLPDGRLVHLETPGVTERTRDREALRSVGLDPDSSLTRRYLIVSGSDGLSGTEAIEGTRVEPEQLARFHLERSAWSDLNFISDTVRVVQAEEEDGVSVTFRADTLLAGMQPRVRVEVGVTGNLRDLVLDDYQVDQAETDESNITISTGGREGPMAVMNLVAHIVLFIFLLALFFRRLDARLIDTMGALRDGLWGAFWGLTSAALVIGYSVAGSTGSGVLPVLLAVFISITAAAATLLVVFLASAVGDSYAREVWPEPVRSLDLVRRLSPLNRTVGASLIHGVSLAGLILAVCTLALWLPEVSLPLSSALPTQESWRPVISSVAGETWFSVYAVLAIAAAVGGLLRRRSDMLSFVVPVLIFGIIEITPLSVNPAPVGILLSLIVGSMVMGAFVNHGAVAAVTALVAAGVLFHLAPGLVAAPIAETLDAVVALALLGAVLVLGFIGATSDERFDDGEIYVPAYVRELNEQQRIERELEIARDVQMSFLPRVMPTVAGADTAAVCVPANEVGGDYYDIILLDERHLAVLIGDVSGKGIQAAFYMTLVKGIIQSLASASTPPCEVLSNVNRIFYRNAPRGMFISLIYGVYDVRTGRFVYGRAGHNPLLVARATGAAFERPPGIAIGLAPADSFDESIREQVVELEPGESVVLYTDGVSEAMNAEREQFGEERIASAVVGTDGASAADILSTLHDAVNRFIAKERLLDDMTMMVLRREQVSENGVSEDHS